MLSKLPLSFGLILYLYIKNIGLLLATIIFGTLFIQTMTFLFSNERYNLLLSFYEKHNLQVEYQHILNNLEQSIITDTSLGIKFFNNQGHKLL